MIVNEKKLLIIGAGGHGQVAAEVAADCGYTNIKFLDDNSQEAIGKICELEKFCTSFTDVFIGIGNNFLRDELQNRAKNIGYHIPTLIHTTAYVSKTAVIEEGTIVEPKSIVNTNAIVHSGCIVSVGAIIDHDVTVEAYTHINTGAIVGAGACIEKYKKIEAGEIIKGY